MAKSATPTVAEQQSAFVAQLHTDSVRANIAKFAKGVGSLAQLVRQISDEVEKNGGRYAHYVASKSASPVEKAMAQELRRDWIGVFAKNITNHAVAMSDYNMDKAVFMKMVEGDEKAKVDANRKFISRILSKHFTDFTKELAKIEGIEIKPTESASKGDEGEGDSIEPTPTDKTPTQKAIDAGNAFAKALRATDVPDDAIAAIYQIIALLGGTPESE